MIGTGPAIALVARREITQRMREKSFLISMGVTVAIVVLVAVLAVSCLGGSDGRADVPDPGPRTEPRPAVPAAPAAGPGRTSTAGRRSRARVAGRHTVTTTLPATPPSARCRIASGASARG